MQEFGFTYKHKKMVLQRTLVNRFFFLQSHSISSCVCYRVPMKKRPEKWSHSAFDQKQNQRGNRSRLQVPPDVMAIGKQVWPTLTFNLGEAIWRGEDVENSEFRKDVINLSLISGPARMAQFRKDLEGFSASRTVKIGATETLENYTVSFIWVTSALWVWVTNWHALNLIFVSNKYSIWNR